MATVNKEIPEEVIKKIALTEVKNQKINSLKNSKRLINFSSVKIYDQDADNFMRTRVTVVVECEQYKIPRIVKNYLLRSI